MDPGSALLSLAYDAPSGAWRGELVTTAVAAKREVDRSRVDLYRTGSYVTLDLLGQADLGHGLALDAGVFNLTNQDYIEWADVRGRPVGDPLIPYYTRPGPQHIGDAALAVLSAAARSPAGMRSPRSQESRVTRLPGRSPGRNDGPQGIQSIEPQSATRPRSARDTSHPSPPPAP